LPVKPLPKVFVVNVDRAVLSSIEVLLTAQGYDVKCFASADEFIAQYHPNHVGCVVIDLVGPGIGGSELMRHLHETRSLLSIVIISGLIDSAVHRQHEKGPAPILAKAYEVWTLLTMVEDAIAGSLKRDRVLAPTVSTQVDSQHHDATNVPAKDKLLTLSPRQLEVMSFLLRGDSVKEVAQTLELSEHTVGDYVKQIYKHFSVSSRAELLALFISREHP
jgi:FixJ family two-component response regulator